MNVSRLMGKAETLVGLGLLLQKLLWSSSFWDIRWDIYSLKEQN